MVLAKCFFLSFLLMASSLHALELKRVILSTNSNPKYIEFWPVVAPIYQAMGLRPTLALIADESCPIDTSLGDVIRFTPIPGVSEALQAQVIRLFLPALFPDDGCLISDIDMLPISRAYFFNGAKNCPDDAFLVYRDGAAGYEGKRFPMCYNAAKGSVFASIFNISRPEDIRERIVQWASMNHGWSTDEILLYIYALEWEKKGGRLVRLGHSVEGRLDRAAWKKDFRRINISKYIDCHCPRPYSAHRKSIDQIVEAIYKQLK